jgi:hypothetical protein
LGPKTDLDRPPARATREVANYRPSLRSSRRQEGPRALRAAALRAAALPLAALPLAALRLAGSESAHAARRPATA